MDLYFGGNLDAAFALGGQVAGRIDDIRPVAEIISETITDCETRLAKMRHLSV
jgi:enoyl-[acyl-carrier protein] reductase II